MTADPAPAVPAASDRPPHLQRGLDESEAARRLAKVDAAEQVARVCLEQQAKSKS